MSDSTGAEQNLSTSRGQVDAEQAPTTTPRNTVVLKAAPAFNPAEAERFIAEAFGKTASPIEVAAFYDGGNRSFFWSMGEEYPAPSSPDGFIVINPEAIAGAIASGNEDGILSRRVTDAEPHFPEAWYIRMTTLASSPEKGRGGHRNIREFIGFWVDGDYNVPGHHKRREGDLPLPQNADEVREIWRAAGFPEPSIEWHTGGGINGLWLLEDPLVIADAPEGAELFQTLKAATARWGNRVAQAAKDKGLHHDTAKNLDRLLRIPGSVNRKVFNEYKPVTATYTGKRYTIDELMACIPEPVVLDDGTTVDPITGAVTEPVRKFTGVVGSSDGLTPWDSYNKAMWQGTSFRDQIVADGWTHHGWRGQIEDFTRPGKEPGDGLSASFGANEDADEPKLYVFSDSAPGLLGTTFQGQFLDPYRYLVATQYNGDFKECAKALRQNGHGGGSPMKNTPTPVAEVSWDELDTDDYEIPETQLVREGDQMVEKLTEKGRAQQLKNMASMGVKPPLTEDGTEAPMEPQIIFRRASSIRVRKTNWLWDTTPEGATPTSQGRIPKDMLTMAAGLPGTGKSQWAIWMTAQITNGTLPGCYYGEPRNVVYAATEDDWARTIAPRLIAAGADLDRVFHVVVRTVDMKHVQLSVPEHHDALGKFAQENDVAMVVFDPMLSHLGGKINANSEAEVRAALEPLVRAAAKYEFTVIGLSHFNKNTGDSDPLNRLMGSRGFSALLRALIVFAKDTDADDDESPEVRYVVSQAKNNLGRTDMPSYSYTIASAVVETDEGEAYVSKFVLGGETDTSVEKQMASAGKSDEDREMAKDCKGWLKGYLIDQGGEAYKADVDKAGKEAGFSSTTIYRARTALGIKSKSVGFGKAKAAVLHLPGA